jgi:hypothetical protein
VAESRSKPRPKTGERRETNQPLKIDRLPSSVHDDILHLRNTRGKTWQEIEALSAEPVKLEDGSKGGGFIDWPALPFEILQLFPEMRLPHSSLHRWYDLRVAQVRKDVLVRSQQALKIAESFAKSQMVNGDEAVINAVRDTLMGVLSEDGTESGRLNATKGLIKLGELMQKAKTNEIRDRKVGTEERRIKLLEDREAATIKKMERETEAVARKIGKGELTLDDINRLRERTFGLPPLVADAAK